MKSANRTRLNRTARYVALGCFGLALAYGVTVHFTNAVFPEDDGFITYRYVENLVAGKGLVYNPGERVFGASNPLYLFWLALLKSEARDVPVPDLAVRMNFIFWVATAVGVFFLIRRLVRSPALSALFAGLLLMRNDLLYESLGGMESFLFAALVVWSIWALATRRRVLSAALAGLSVMVRLEGVLLAAIVFIGWLAQVRKCTSHQPATRKSRAHFLIPGVLVLPAAIWVVFAFAYFGSPVYQSIIAKSRPLYALPFGHALWHVADHLGAWTTSALIAYESRIGGVLLPVRLMMALFGLAVACLGYVLRRRLLRLGRSAALPVAALFFLLVLFYFISNPLMFDWYYPILEILWFAVLIAGIIWLASWLKSRLRWAGIVLTSLLVLALAYPAFAPPLTRLLSGDRLTGLDVESDEVRTRIIAYQQTAEWLNQTVPPNWVVAGPEVGALGYYYKGRILDACGLVSCEATPFLPVPKEERSHPESGAISRELVQSLQPDVVATMSDFAYLSLYQDSWFQKSYVPVKQFDLSYELWGSKSIDVFFRRDHVKVEE
jgi:hypothetical protein